MKKALPYIIMLFILHALRELTIIMLNTAIYDTPFPYNHAYLAPPKFLLNFSKWSLFILKVGFYFLYTWLYTFFSTIILRKLNMQKNIRFFKIFFWMIFLMILSINALNYIAIQSSFLNQILADMLYGIHTPFTIIIFVMYNYKKTFK
ncbi:MAG: hypothetical protein KatS3mg034_0271 [Vicingaceae bacterium]|nr:MAG: hypothetical protein KatS3mg034_0271 [Vicingaceae bacterium]